MLHVALIFNIHIILISFLFSGQLKRREIVYAIIEMSLRYSEDLASVSITKPTGLEGTYFSCVSKIHYKYIFQELRVLFDSQKMEMRKYRIS